MIDSDRPIALVTGANRGIGLEVARQLAERGHHVVVGARRAAAAERAVAAIDGRATPMVLDVTAPDTVASTIRAVESELGRLDALVNNAAIHYDTWQRAADPDFGVVREAIETNLLGAWAVASAAIPLLRRSEHPRIVNVSSGSGSLTDMGAGPPAYSITKAALNALTCLLAAELRADGILVNSVCPGWVATDMGGAGGRPVRDGAAGIVWAATLPDGGPTGGFFRDGHAIAW